VETLMGHPLVRGGQRPRDFPADPAGRLAVVAAVELQARPMDSWNPHRIPSGLSWRFGSWLYAFVMLVEGQVLGTEPDRADDRCHEAVLWVVYQVLRAVRAETDDAACQRVLAALGLGLRDAGPLMEPPLSQWGKACHLNQQQDNPVAAAAEAAALAASLEEAQTAGGKDPALASAKNPLARAMVAGAQVWLVTLKTHRVQPYLARARELWGTRGASVWAAQALSLAREELLAAAQEPGLVLLADVDALSRFACFTPPDCALLKARLQRRLRAIWSPVGLRSGALDRRYPRLANFLRSLPDPGLAGAHMAACLPDFSLDVSRPLTLPELCLCRPFQDPEEGARGRTRALLRFAGAPRRASGCDFVQGDPALAAEACVPWMHAGKAPRRVGWTGLVWALAGATYRMHACHGLAEAQGYTATPLRHGGREWLEDLGLPGQPLAFLKLDGDHVGANLGQLPLLRALGAGLELHTRVFSGLDLGIRRARRWLDERGTGFGIPVEVVYQGGDDLLCMLPAAVLDPFLQGFARGPRTLAAATFTGAAITFPAALADLRQEVPFLAARMLPAALEWAKGRSRGQAVGRQAAFLSKAAHEGGFRLTWPAQPRRFGPQVAVWELELEPLAGKAALGGLRPSSRSSRCSSEMPLSTPYFSR
jgi:hypothetical protein